MKFFMGIIFGIVLTIAVIIGLNYWSRSVRQTLSYQAKMAMDDFVDDFDDALHQRGEIKLPTIIGL